MRSAAALGIVSFFLLGAVANAQFVPSGWMVQIPQEIALRTPWDSKVEYITRPSRSTTGCSAPASS